MAYNELKQHGTEDFPLELYCLDDSHPKYIMAHHWHTNLEIIRVVQGELEVKFDDRTYCAKKGDILFINSEIIHSATPKGSTYQCLVFDPHFLAINPQFDEFINHITNHGIFIQEVCTDNDVKNAANALFDTMKNSDDGYRFLAVGQLLCIFGLLQNKRLLTQSINTKDQNAKDLYKLKQVLNFIRKSYSKQITLHDMASVAKVSPKYFCSFFKSMTSKTPIEYLNSYRIEKACAKLRTSDKSVTEIAFLCGFNDLSYFIKVFKQIKGISPKKYREH